MRANSYWIWLMAAGVSILPGCAEPAPSGVAHTHNPEAEVTVCGHCGQVKGSDDCCAEGAEICSICGKHQDSVLCCSTAITGVRDVVLCRKCGEVAFTDDCCQEGATACAKCGLHEGSPGCCKLDKIDAAVMTQSNAHHGH